MNRLERIHAIAVLTWRLACALWVQLCDYRLKPGDSLSLHYELQVVHEESETECGV